MSEENNGVTIGNEVVDLASLAGVDMSEVQEVRSLVLPAGQYLMKVIDAKLESREVQDRSDDAAPDAKINKPVIDFELEVTDCMALTDDKLDPGAMVGRKHHNSIWITDLAKDLGRAKAFMADIGVDCAGALETLLNESHGVEFVTTITNTKDKNDPDRVYANLKNTMTVAKWQEKNAE